MTAVYEEIDTDKPTDAEIKAYLKSNGVFLFEDFTFDHLDDEQTEKLQQAINAAKEFSKEVGETRTPRAMIILATEKDNECTGYGCGKTSLAKAIASAKISVGYASRNEIYYTQRAHFVTARDVLDSIVEYQQTRGSSYSSIFAGGGLLIIDDVGREGSLQFEKRDMDSQLTEKQHRYYSIINRCYERGINLVLTTNMSSRELATFLGGASWSRLLQMCPPKYRINLTGIKDMRPLLSETDWF